MSPQYTVCIIILYCVLYTACESRHWQQQDLAKTSIQSSEADSCWVSDDE